MKLRQKAKASIFFVSTSDKTFIKKIPKQTTEQTLMNIYLEIHDLHYNDTSLDRLSNFEKKFWLFHALLKYVNHTTKYDILNIKFHSKDPC